MSHEKILQKLVPQYVAEGELASFQQLHGGLINATYLLHITSPQGAERLVFQRVNTAVFNKPELVMENVKLVTKHLKQVVPQGRNLNLEFTIDGASYILDGQGGLWRAFNYLAECVGHETVQSLTQAEEAGRAFGHFLSQLEGLDASQLHEIIPNFHHTPSRLRALEEACAQNTADRAGIVTRQMEFIKERREVIDLIEDLREAGELPLRTTHNDTKVSNVLFDKATGKAVCVIDLDTVMPGTVLYDFGDLVRTSVNTVPEDASEAEVTCDLEIFEALTKGYLEAAQDTLTEVEVLHLVDSAKVITLELAMRFLTDYLKGDRYFRVARETQNLERARNQLRLVELIEEKEAEMRDIVDRLSM